MANSSDWLGALAGLQEAEPQGVAPGWLAMLREPAEFREAFAFGTRATGPVPAEPPTPKPDPTVAAVARAYADGEAAGRLAALAEAAAEATRQRALRLAFRTLDEAARNVLADDLAATVIALCDGALAGCAVDSDALLARCHTAAQRIGAAAETLNLHLHPHDIAALDPAALDCWTITPDPALERGALRIETADGAISDGPAEWRRAIAAAVRG